MTGSDADADDITHQTFLTVARIAGTYDGRASVRAWVLGVAARYLADQRRASARLRRFLGRLLAEQEPARDLRAAAEARLELGAVARA
ncbi:MAG: sigma-70 family RNA polymerase sigma factor [Myxococcales bacterium]|nr:sigma-70 family RNA polymerase sigma factor [Myxococcales bacterium]